MPRTTDFFIKCASEVRKLKFCIKELRQKPFVPHKEAIVPKKEAVWGHKEVFAPHKEAHFISKGVFLPCKRHKDALLLQKEA